MTDISAIGPKELTGNDIPLGWGVEGCPGAGSLCIIEVQLG